MAGYHTTAIPRGRYGEESKITEEYLEFKDALSQNNKVMAIVELSDLLGAIEAYVLNFNMSIDDLIRMKDATKRAFEDGTREDRNVRKTPSI